jgi:hypothetical protein
MATALQHFWVCIVLLRVCVYYCRRKQFGEQPKEKIKGGWVVNGFLIVERRDCCTGFLLLRQ